ncbi:hypothetical protein [Curtobacterium sp. Curtsp57]|uniref:hypothetical protein n=1 Tax=Curtobacterium sp. Curtsp57 TaxID=3243047 RepID=UPI0039B58F31
MSGDVDVEDLRVSADEFVAEPVRWFLHVMDGQSVVITRDGNPFALFKPSQWTLDRFENRVRSAHTEPDPSEEGTR